MPDYPFPQVDAADRTERHDALVTINVDLLAANRPASDEAV